jgi:hypothetical protein
MYWYLRANIRKHVHKTSEMYSRMFSYVSVLVQYKDKTLAVAVLVFHKRHHHTLIFPLFIGTAFESRATASIERCLRKKELPTRFPSSELSRKEEDVHFTLNIPLHH